MSKSDTSYIGAEGEKAAAKYMTEKHSDNHASLWILKNSKEL